MGKLRVTGAYVHPDDPDVNGIGETRGRTASEHGQGVVGLYASFNGTTRVTMHDCEAPATPLATAFLPWWTPDSYGNQLRQTAYLGAGRAVIAVATEFIYADATNPLLLRCITYRDGMLTVGPQAALAVADMTFDGAAVSYLENLFLYATSGSSFKLVATAVLLDGVTRKVGVADFAADPAGMITRLAPWRTVSVVMDRVGTYTTEHIPFLVRGGSLFTFGDRIRRYDAETLDLQATSAFGPPAATTSSDWGSRSGFGMPNFGPDGKLEIFEIEMFTPGVYPDFVKTVKVWHVDPVTLEREVVTLDPPHSAGTSASVPEFPNKIWNIMFPPVGPGYDHIQPLGDMRSSMGGLLLALGRSRNADGGLDDGGDSAAALLHTGEWAVAETVPAPGGSGTTNSPEGVFFTRDSYAVALDRRGTIGKVVPFFGTAPVLPPDTIAELGSYRQGYFS